MDRSVGVRKNSKTWFLLVDNIFALRLLGGETILGRVTTSRFSNKTIITEPQLCVVEVSDGKMEISLAPWNPWAREYRFEINNRNIVTMFKVRPNLEQNYKVATGNK